MTDALRRFPLARRWFGGTHGPDLHEAAARQIGA